MNQDQPSDQNLSLYDRLKKKLSKNWMIALLALLAGGIISASNVIDAAKRIQAWLTPEVTMVVTVLDEGIDCGLGIMQRATLDVAINNNSDRAVIVTSVKLIPERVTGNFYTGEFGGEPDLAGTYVVTMRTWHEQALQTGGEWVKPGPIEVKEIAAKKFTVKKDFPQRFRIRMLLARPIDYLYGTIFLEVRTDSGATLRSEPLEISICEKKKEGKDS